MIKEISLANCSAELATFLRQKPSLTLDELLRLAECYIMDHAHGSHVSLLMNKIQKTDYKSGCSLRKSFKCGKIGFIVLCVYYGIVLFPEYYCDKVNQIVSPVFKCNTLIRTLEHWPHFCMEMYPHPSETVTCSHFIGLYIIYCILLV